MYLDDDEISAVSDFNFSIATGDEQILTEKIDDIDENLQLSREVNYDFHQDNRFQHGNYHQHNTIQGIHANGYQSTIDKFQSGHDLHSHNESTIASHTGTDLYTYNPDGDTVGFDLSTIFGSESIVSEAELETITESLNNAEITNAGLKKRLYTRTKLLEQVKESYIRDVVSLKHVINKILSGTEKEKVLDQYYSQIPSLDLRKNLQLYGPTNSSMKVYPCTECGGHVEITVMDSDRVAKLEKRLIESIEKENKLRLSVARLDTLVDSAVTDKNTEYRTHQEEKRFLYSEVRRLKEELENTGTENKRIMQENKKERDRVRVVQEQNKELNEHSVRLVEREKDLAELRAQFTDLQQAHKKLNAEKAALTEEMSEKHDKIGELNGTIKAVSAELRSVKMDLADVENRRKEIIELNNNLTNELATQKKEYKLLDEKFQTYKSEMKDLLEISARDVAAAEAVADQLRDTVSGLKKNIKELDLTILKEKENVRDKEKVIREKDQVIAAKDQVIGDKVAEIDSLEEAVSSMKQFLADSLQVRSTTPHHISSKHVIENVFPDEDDDLNIPGVNENVLDDMKDLFADGGDIVNNLDSMGDKPGTPIDPDRSGSRGRAHTQRIRAAKGAPASNLADGKDGTGDSIVASDRAQFNKKTRPHKKKAAAMLDATLADFNSDEEDEEIRTYYHLLRQKQEYLKIKDNTGTDNAASPSPSSSPARSKSKKNMSKKSFGKKSFTQDDEMKLIEIADSPKLQQHMNKMKQKKEVKMNLMGNAALSNDEMSMLADLAGVLGSDIGTQTSIAPVPRITQSFSQNADSFEADDDEYEEDDEEEDEDNEEETLLLPPRAEAPYEEIMLRSSLLQALRESESSKFASRAINGSVDTLSLYGDILSTALKSIWKSLIFNRKSLDFITKIDLIFNGMLSTTQSDPQVAVMKFLQAIKEIVPLAGVSIHGSPNLLAIWSSALCSSNQELQLRDLLVPTNVDERTYIYKEYNDYFGTDAAGQLNKVNTALAVLDRMTTYTDTKLTELCDKSINVLKDWSDSKKISLNLDTLLANAQNAVKESYEAQVKSISKDSSMATKRYEAAKQQVIDLQQKLEVATAYVEDFEKVKLELAAKIKTITQYKLEMEAMTKSASEQAIAHGTLNDQLQESNRKLQESVKVCKEREALIEVKNDKIVQLSSTIKSLEDSIAPVTKERDFYKERERVRRVGMTEGSCQATEEMANVSIQTEFIDPNMTLRPVIATTVKHNKIIRPKYPHPVTMTDMVDNPYVQAQERILHKILTFGANSINMDDDQIFNGHQQESSTSHFTTNNSDDMSEVSDVSKFDLSQLSSVISSVYTPKPEITDPITYEPISRMHFPLANKKNRQNIKLNSINSPNRGGFMSPIKTSTIPPELEFSNRKPLPVGRKTVTQQRLASLIVSPLSLHNSSMRNKVVTTNAINDDHFDDSNIDYSDTNSIDSSSNIDSIYHLDSASSTGSKKIRYISTDSMVDLRKKFLQYKSN